MDMEEDIETRGYELAYLLLPSTQEDKLEEEIGKIKGFIEKAGGKTASEKPPKKIEIAYTMSVQIKGRKQRFDEAYFGWVRFEAASDSIAGIHEDMREENGVLRFMIVLVDKESLVPSRRDESKEESSTTGQRKAEAEFGGVSAGETSESEEKVESKESVQAKEDTGSKDEASEEEIDKTIDEMVESGSEISDNKATSHT